LTVCYITAKRKYMNIYKLFCITSCLTVCISASELQQGSRYRHDPYSTAGIVYETGGPSVNGASSVVEARQAPVQVVTMPVVSTVVSYQFLSYVVQDNGRYYKDTYLLLSYSNGEQIWQSHSREDVQVVNRLQSFLTHVCSSIISIFYE